MDKKNRSKLAAATGLIVCGIILAQLTIFAAESTPYSRGLELVRDNGCMSCHEGSRLSPQGEARTQGAFAGTLVPPLIGCELSDSEFTSWVLDGSPLGAESLKGASGGLSKLKMPAYKGRLDKKDIADILAWSQIAGHQAGGAAQRPESRIARAEALAEQHGCFECHGPLGQGGVKNPGSLTGQIPGFAGEELKHLCDDSDPVAVEDWIRRGRSERFLSGDPFSAAGRWFMNRQLTKMPGYDETLSDEEVQLLVEYCLHINELGPMDSAAYATHLIALSSLESSEPADEPLIPADEPKMPQDVAALLSAHCIRCHGPKKQKSDYRMDTMSSAFTAGDIASFMETQPITPGQPEESLLVTFIAATEEDPENEVFPMPPDERDRFTHDQITLIREWVAAGAPWHESQTLHSTYSD